MKRYLLWLCVASAAIYTGGDFPLGQKTALAQEGAMPQAIAAGKKATALVDTLESNGSAFCIHTSGLFATNAHVVDGKARVKLVINPGEAGQRIVIAKVTHVDENSDLALLQIDPPLQTQSPGATLTALPLGNLDGLFETMPVSVFGFPFGTDLSLDDKEMPGVTVTTGRITALRKIKGKLKEIQLDAAINPGNSGGPVLNQKGEAIGVVYASVEFGAGLNFAIPIDSVQTLLRTPGVSFNPEPSDWEQRSKLQQWRIEVVPSPALDDITQAPGGAYELEVQIGGKGRWRNLDVFPAPEDRQKTFIAKGALVPPGEPEELPIAVKIIVRQNSRVLATQESVLPVVNGPMTVRKSTAPSPGILKTSGRAVLNPENGHWYQMARSELRINFSDAKAAAEAMTHQGIKGHLATVTSASEQKFIKEKILSGPQNSRGNAWLGGYQGQGADEPAGGWRWVTNEPWDFTSWNAGEPNNAGDEDVLEISPEGGWNDGRGEEAQAVAVIEYEDANSKPGAPTNALPADAPQVDGDRTYIDLPGPATQVVAGGDGRYLLFYLRAEKKIAVFDSTAGKIVRYIATPAENVLVAAGKDKAVVVLKDQNLLQRWKLETGEREASAVVPNDGQVDSIALGSASGGPIFLSSGNTPSFLDLATLRPIETVNAEAKAGARPPRSGRLGTGTSSFAAASADGTVFSVRTSGTMNSQTAFSLEGNRLTKLDTPGGQDYLLPSHDGRLFFTSNGILSEKANPVAAEHLRDMLLVPTSDAAYFLALKNPNGRQFGGQRGATGMQVSLYSANDRALLATLGTFDEISNPRPVFRSEAPFLPLQNRIYYMPAQNLLVTLTDSLDQIVMRKVNLMQEVVKATGDYFFIASVPPRRAFKNRPYSYKVEAKARRSGLHFSIENGPAGLTVSPEGLIQWTPPADFNEAGADVVLNIRDGAGREIFHSFNIKVEAEPKG